MKTAKKAPKLAGRPTAEDEVKTTEHDALLAWLIEHLDEVADQLFGRDEAWLREKVKAAKKAAKEHWQSLAREFHEHAKEGATLKNNQFQPVNVTPEGRRDFAKAADILRQWASEMPFEEAPDSFASGRVESYEAMKPVERVEDRPTTTKRSPAGFVDLAAVMREPESLSLKEGQRDDSNNLFNYYAQEDALLAFVEALTPESVTWSIRSKRHAVWFSVRSGQFTLGEILQELKNLRRLEDQKHTVALCVAHIGEDLRAHIEHEGFPVIAAEDWE